MTLRQMGRSLLWGLIVFGSLSVISNDREQKSQQTQQELEKVKLQIKSLQQQLDKKRKQYGSAASTLKKTEQRINSAAKILRATQGQIKQLNRELISNRKQQQQLQKEKQKHLAILSQQIRSAYSSGQQEYLKLLLNQEDPARLGRMLAYYDYLNKARTESIRVLGETIVSINQLQKSIEANLKELAILERSQLEEQERLEKLKKRRKSEVEKLARSIASEDKKLTNLRENEEELESLLRQMRQMLEQILQQQDLDGLASVKGKMSWPIRGKVKQNFGETLNADIRSNGIKIAANEGDEIAAVFHGRVVFSDWLRGFGLLIIIDHGKGYMTLYGNNQSLFKDVGEWVEAGELLATVGQSGGQRQSGLYFEVRHQGKAIDPLVWMK